MSTHAIAAYETLRRKVKETLLLGQERIEQEKVRTYWETAGSSMNTSPSS